MLVERSMLTMRIERSICPRGASVRLPCLSKGACLQCVSRGASVRLQCLSKGACLQCVSRGASVRLQDGCSRLFWFAEDSGLFWKGSTCHSTGLFIDLTFSDFQRLIWKKAVRGDPIRAMIPPKMPQIAQSSLDPSVPERGRFGKGPAGAAALAAFMAFIALAFIAFIGKGAAALAAFMAFIAMRDGPAPRVKRAAETEATPPMPMREKKHDGGTQSSRTGTSEPKWRRR